VAFAAAIFAAPAWGYHLVHEDYLSLASHADPRFVSHGTHVAGRGRNVVIPDTFEVLVLEP
jgi:hypothetical protein